jgi:hypothetical protein
MKKEFDYRKKGFDYRTKPTDNYVLTVTKKTGEEVIVGKTDTYELAQELGELVLKHRDNLYYDIYIIMEGSKPNA